MKRLVAAVAVVGLTSGCGGLRGVDLPGGADLGDHPYAVTIELADVVDLVPQSLVKVADVPVGAVSAIAVESMLLNGGGVAQIRTISTELNHALAGNEPQVRALLANLNTLVTALDSRKGEITRALDGINRLAATLAARRGAITTALDDLQPGLAELERQRGQLVDMLQSLDRLSGVATHVVDAGQEDLLTDLRSLQPTLAKLAASGQNLPTRCRSSAASRSPTPHRRPCRATTRTST